MPFGMAGFLWNSVDVRGTDGLLHHGRIVDASAEGLVVDFGGPPRSRPRLFPVGQVYRCKESDCFHRRRLHQGPQVHEDERALEVLVRHKPMQPWKWYPGVLLHYLDGIGTGIVSVTLSDGKRIGVAAAYRMRPRSTQGWLDSRRVTAGQFSKKWMVVPNENDGRPLPPDAQLLDVINNCFREDGSWMLGVQVVSNARHGRFEEVGILGVFSEYEWLQRSSTQPLELGFDTKSLVTMLKKDDPLTRIRTLFPEMPTIDGSIQSLCADVLSEVFQCLDTPQQTAVRGVCTAWESILTSPSIQRVLSITRASPTVSSQFLASLYYGWNRQTKIIVLKECGLAHTNSPWLANTTRLLRAIMRNRKLPLLQTVLLTNTECKFAVLRGNWIDAWHGDLTSLTEVCSTVILRGISVEVHCRPPGRDVTDKMYVTIREGRVTRQLTVKDLWTILGDKLPEVGPKELAKLSEWVREVSTVPTTELWTVAQVINTTQTQDPRDGVHYRGQTFYPYGDSSLAGVDVSKLSLLTLHSLLDRYYGRDWDSDTYFDELSF